MLPGGLVGDFCELANELFEYQSHLGVGDRLGMEVDVGELFGDQVEELRLGQPIDLGLEFEPLENIANGRGKALNVGVEVFTDVILVPHELLHVERRRVIEELAGLLEQKRLRFSPAAFRFSNSAKTERLVASKTQSNRRSTVNGRMTLPYSDCL